MAFRFTSGAYHWSPSWTAAQKTQVQFILKMGTQTGARPTDMLKMMTRAGIKYRKTNMLENIGRAQGIEQSKTIGAAKRAEQWFNTTEKYLKMNPGMHRHQAADFMRRWKTESWETIEEAEAANQLEMEGACPSPPCPPPKEEREKRKKRYAQHTL